MALVKLHWKERESLQRIAHSSSNGRAVRRAQALLWLDAGESMAQVADRLNMSRQAIYDLVDRYQSQHDKPVGERVRDQSHAGRPPEKLEATIEVIEPLLSQNPREYGYRELVWTVPILRRQVEKQTGARVSHQTMRRALHVLRYRYKRPRYVSSRRSPTWKQAKGGSNAA